MNYKILWIYSYVWKKLRESGGAEGRFFGGKRGKTAEKG